MNVPRFLNRFRVIQIFREYVIIESLNRPMGLGTGRHLFNDVSVALHFGEMMVLLANDCSFIINALRSFLTLPRNLTFLIFWLVLLDC